MAEDFSIDDFLGPEQQGGFSIDNFLGDAPAAPSVDYSPPAMRDLREGDVLAASRRGETSGLPDPTQPESTAWETTNKLWENWPALRGQAIGGLIQWFDENLPGTEIAAQMEALNQMEDMTPEQIAGLDVGKMIAEEKTKGGLATFGREWAEEASAEIQKNQPNVDPWSIKGLTHDTAQGLIQMTPMLILSLAAKKPIAGLTVFGAEIYGAEYARARQSGRPPSDAVQDATAKTVFEAIPESIPLGVIMKPGGRFLPKVFKGGGAEGVQELLTEILNIGYDIGVLDEEMTWGEAVSNMGRATIIGFGMGAGMGAVAAPFTRDRPTPPGEREAAAGQPAPAKPGDAESPAADLVAEGREILKDGEATQRANAILDRMGQPHVGQRITKTENGVDISGVVDDAFAETVDELGITDEGIKIRLDDGTTFEAFGKTLADMGVALRPEGEVAAPVAPITAAHREQLGELGYSPEDITTMTPDTANAILGAGTRKEIPDDRQREEGLQRQEPQVREEPGRAVQEPEEGVEAARPSQALLEAEEDRADADVLIPKSHAAGYGTKTQRNMILTKAKAMLAKKYGDRVKVANGRLTITTGTDAENQAAADEINRQTDITIKRSEAGRKRGAPKGGPQSLNEFLASRGGVLDVGGELAAMDMDKWHQGKSFRRKFIRAATDVAQADIEGRAPRADTEFELDAVFEAAVDDGFFPEYAGQDIRALDGANIILEAIRDGDTRFRVEDQATIDEQTAIAEDEARREARDVSPEATSFEAQLAEIRSIETAQEEAYNSWEAQTQEHLEPEERYEAG